MSRLRTLLLCLLMLALPFQGFAAAAMAACAMPQAATAHADAQATHHGNMHQHAQHGNGMHQAAQHVHGGDQAADPAQHAASHDHQADGSSGDHTCSVCSICHASAVVDTHVAIQAHALPDASPSMRPHAMASLVPSLPDKPPRA